jgi:hypothetical protein
LRWFQRHLDTASQHLNSRFAAIFAAMRRLVFFAFRKIVVEPWRRAPPKWTIAAKIGRIAMAGNQKGGRNAAFPTLPWPALELGQTIAMVARHDYRIGRGGTPCTIVEP